MLLFVSQNSEQVESGSEYFSAGCHDKHDCTLKTNTDDDYEDDDAHSTSSTKLEDDEGSIRVQLPPLRNSQEAVFRRNGNISTDHQVFVRRKRQQLIDISKFNVRVKNLKTTSNRLFFIKSFFSSKDKYFYKPASKRRNNYRQYTTSTTASSELPLTTSPDDSFAEETIDTGLIEPKITGSVISFYYVYLL